MPNETIPVVETDLDTLSMLDGVLLCDGFESAFVGLMFRFGLPEPIACYDYQHCLDILVSRDGMTALEAEEYFHFNTLGAWAGDRTPCFLAGSRLEQVQKHFEDYSA